MVKCPNCGTDVSDKNIEYCPECGARVRKIETINKVIIEKESKENKTARTITAGLVISWIIGLLFVLEGFGVMLGLSYSTFSYIPKYLYHLMGLIELCIGILILPIINKYLETRFDIKLSRGFKILMVIAFIIFVTTLWVKYAPKPQPTFPMLP